MQLLQIVHIRGCDLWLSTAKLGLWKRWIMHKSLDWTHSVQLCGRSPITQAHNLTILLSLLYYSTAVWLITIQQFRRVSSLTMPKSLTVFTRPWLHYVRSLLSQIRLSSVTFVHPTQGIATFGNISSPFCTFAILWPPYNFTEIVPGNLSAGGVKRKRGIATYVTFGSLISWWVYCYYTQREPYTWNMKWKYKSTQRNLQSEALCLPPRANLLK